MPMHLESECLERNARLRGHTESIGERMERDLGALLALPAAPYDASDKHATRVSSQSWCVARCIRTQGEGLRR